MKVGEYVRTDKGEIGKVTSIANNNDFGLGEEYRGFVAFNTEPYVYGDVIKSSPNIIDLIEVGDYVNGCLVLHKENNELVCGLLLRYKEEDIQNVVTKEQFEAMKYEIK